MAEPSAASERGESKGEPAAWWALAAFLAAEAGALVLFMVLARKMWFDSDEWEFLAKRTAFNLGDLFRPHYGHWVTLPVLAYRGLWWAFGLRTYRPYQLAIVLLHLIAALLLRTLMRRCGVRPWTATAVALIFVFLGTDFLNIAYPFQITLVGSLVFGFAQMLIVTPTETSRRADLVGLACGGAALMCSGVGITTTVAVGVAVLMRKGARPALTQTAPLGLMYLLWYATAGHRQGYGPVHYSFQLGAGLRFVSDLSVWSFDAVGQVFGVALVLVALLAVGLALAWIPLGPVDRRRNAAIPLGLLVGAALFLIMTAVARSEIGNVRDFGSRYFSVVVAFVLPAIGIAADAIMQRWRAAIPLVIVVLLIGIPGNIAAFSNTVRDPARVKREQRLRALMLSLPYVPVAKNAPRNVVPNPDGVTYLVSIGWLRAGAASGRVPKPRYISAAQRAEDTLRLSFLQQTSRPVRSDVCASLERPLTLRLRRNTHVVIGAPDNAARIDPIRASVAGTLPLETITAFGATYVATRAVGIRITALTPAARLVCAPPSTFSPGTATFSPYGKRPG